VVNILTGSTTEIGPWLAGHGDVNAIDLCGAAAEERTDLERAAAGTVKRVIRATTGEPDWFAEPGIARLRAVLEAKTVWHPTGT
jgi:hypothetical protein